MPKRKYTAEFKSRIIIAILQGDKEFNVIIDGYLPDDDVYVGRSYMDAPDIDGMIFIDSSRELLSGEIVRVKITDSDIYDLEARLI